MIKRHVVLDEEHRRASSFWMVTIRGPKASVSRWARPAVGSSRQSTLASRAKQPGQLDHPAGAGGQVADVVVPIAAQAEEIDELAHLGLRGPVDDAGPRAGRARSTTCRLGPSPRARRAVSR